MGNSQTSNVSDGKSFGKNRRNSNVKGRMLARFGNRKSKAILCADDDFTNVGQQCIGAPTAADVEATALDNTGSDGHCKLPDYSSVVVVEHRKKSTDSEANKRISFISQGADSAKDALDCGESILYCFLFFLFLNHCDGRILFITNSIVYFQFSYHLVCSIIGLLRVSQSFENMEIWLWLQFLADTIFYPWSNRLAVLGKTIEILIHIFKF